MDEQDEQDKQDKQDETLLPGKLTLADAQE